MSEHKLPIYRVVHFNTGGTIDFQDECNRMISHGYKPYGDISVTKVDDRRLGFTQVFLLADDAELGEHA